MLSHTTRGECASWNIKPTARWEQAQLDRSTIYVRDRFPIHCCAHWPAAELAQKTPPDLLERWRLGTLDEQLCPKGADNSAIAEAALSCGGVVEICQRLVGVVRPQLVEDEVHNLLEVVV